MGRFIRLSFFLGFGFLFSAGCQTGDQMEEGPLPFRLKSSRWIPESPKLLALGKTVYLKNCSPCHGPDGRGEGEAAYLLYPKPRDFVSDRYRMVSTWEGLPTDENIYFTISRGIPGSAMPPWAHLPEETRWGLVHYVKSLAENPIKVNLQESEKGSGIIKVPPEQPYTPEALSRAKDLFLQGCAPCHGSTGRGDGALEQIDNKGYPIRPRDFTQGVFKGSPEPKEVYRRIIAGMPGTPMPENGWLYGADAWHLTHLILSLSGEKQRDLAEMKKFRIVASRVEHIPDHPDAGIWREDTSSVTLHLMPLWWRSDRPEILTVQALHDGNEIAFRLMWSDETHDHTAIRVQDFRDAAAVEFSSKKDPPFFGMGEKTQDVNIWMWKSERQADLDPVFQDIDKIYPNLGIDSYPNSLRSALEQPTRQALTLKSDPTYITGWGAGNIVSDPTRLSAAEDLNAKGFGTLKARPIPDQHVQAKGIFDVATYRVVFRRTLRGSGKNSIDLYPGHTIQVAFAIWNGNAGDRDGKKSVTIWQELVIAK